MTRCVPDVFKGDWGDMFTHMHSMFVQNHNTAS